MTIIGLFLKIVKKCPEIETLNIQILQVSTLRENGSVEDNKDTVNTLNNGFLWRFFGALQSAHKLGVFRYSPVFEFFKIQWLRVLFVNFCGRLKIGVTSNSFHEMIRLLSKCTPVIRLGLVVTSIDLADGANIIEMYKWHENDFTALFVDLVRHLSNLVALLIVLPGAPQSHCISATATLEKIFRPERPCFCVQITESLERKSPPNLPRCHYRVLALDPPPLVGSLPFHLVSQEPKL